jgi:hypothetical protein
MTNPTDVMLKDVFEKMDLLRRMILIAIRKVYMELFLQVPMTEALNVPETTARSETKYGLD